MNLMQKFLIARKVARMDFGEVSQAPPRRGFRIVLMLIMGAMIVEGAIDCFKSYF